MEAFAAVWREEGEDYYGRTGVGDDDPIFAIGDVVALITGSPHMAVVDTCPCGATVEVCWCDDNGMQFADFPEEVLVLIDIPDCDVD